ncbi:oxidoreductase [Spongiactinospora gelatinilytica]|uniref:Oxidoreductase n=1 Tax=Spongiactinospora gelatinilytica TaxID=2666298 RepID=A0A2W2HYX0_9ACTN|nr:SDR family NAD(P)-dependent oxidoreductase [Spongiactinospora gelatinilytica]PZG56665.1 oxidoreductase [Spongiactinospora gelatinilytica]
MRESPENGPATALITGAGSGIGAATAVRLANEGYRVLLVGRRIDRLEFLVRQLVAEGRQAEALLVDVTDEAAVKAMAGNLDRCDVLINNAGGAFGTEPISDALPSDWRAMYEVNVLGALHMTQALLPYLIASGDGTIVIVSSTASFTVYEGGGGYSAAKHGERVLAATLRLELCGEPVRVIDIAPGMVHTEEFSLNRYRGDAEQAAAVYAGVDHPLVADDVADAIAWAITRPSYVNVDLLVLRPRAQAAQHKVHRRP